MEPFLRWTSKWRWHPETFPSLPTWPIGSPAATVWPRLTVTLCMCAYQVVREPAPVVTLTSCGPAQPWLVSISMVPAWAA